MAWIFAAWVQCGTPEQARAVAEHFRGVRLDTEEGVSTCEVHIGADSCCWVTPTNVSRIGITDARCAEHLSKVGHGLFERLRTAPPFRSALVGVEVDEVRSDDEIVAIARETDPAYRGLVIDEELWRTAGCPSLFEPFSQGRRWWPYQGERCG